VKNRPGSSYITAAVSLVIAGAGVTHALIYDLSAPNFSAFFGVVAAVGGVWVFYVLPSAEIEGEVLILHNPLTIVQVGLGAITNVETRYALTVEGDFGKATSWAAHPPGRLRHKSHSLEDLTSLGLKPGESVRPGDLPSTLCGSLALQIRRFLKDGPNNGNTSFRRTPNWVSIAALVVPTAIVLYLQI
jgi:hypothetical protein